MFTPGSEKQDVERMYGPPGPCSVILRTSLSAANEERAMVVVVGPFGVHNVNSLSKIYGEEYPTQLPAP